MANAYGSWQNRGRIEWVYTIDAESSGQRLVRVTAYFAQQSGGWHQNYTGTKSWSGGWGSGSAAQTYNLSSGQRVQIVQGSQYVTLGDTARTASFTATANHFFGSSTSTLSVSVPARKPLAPSGLSVTRNSDTSHRLNWSRNSTYTGVVVQRRTNGGSWQQVSAPSGNLATWTDTTTVANRQYQYRVAGKSAGGTSGFSNTVTVYTTPAAPSAVSATRVGDDIRVSASGLPPYATSYDVQDDGTTVATSVGLPWTHVAPSPAVTHRYRVRAKRGSLVSGWSAYSSTVQLAAPPNAPTNLSPNGSVRSVDEDVTFSWRHNPVDASEQTAYELRYRPVGGAWTTVSGSTAESRAVSLGTGSFEWQVRTKGTHPDWGPWSATATVAVIDRPGAAIIVPDDGWDEPRLTVEWTYFQDQGRPQSAWRVELLDEGLEQVEFHEGSGALTQYMLASRLRDESTYTVRVWVAAGGVWSDAAEQLFEVAFVPPVEPVVDAEWNEGSGAVDLSLDEGEDDGSAPAAVQWTIERSIDDRESWEPFTTVDEMPANLTDPEALSNGVTWYRVSAVTAAGAASETVVDVVADSDALWLAGGVGFTATARLPYSPNVTVTSGRERSLMRYAGREQPVAYAGEGTSYTVDASGMIPESEVDVATVAALERLAQEREPLFMFRDPDGRRVYGMLPQIALPRKQAGVWEWSFTLTQAT